MSQVFPEILEQLDSEREEAKERLSRLEAELAETKARLKQLDAARKALGGPQQIPGTKPSPTKQDVIEAAERILKRSPGLAREELKQEIEKLVTENGKDRKGLAMRINEALSDGRFVESEQGFELREPEAA